MHILSGKRQQGHQLPRESQAAQSTYILYTRRARSKHVVETIAIAYWILLNIRTCPAAKLHQAIDDCVAMRDFPTQKNAD